MIMNFEPLLAPVSDEQPVGRNMEYEPIYNEIREARESDPDYLPQGEWATQLRKADWSKVIRLSSQVLQKESKDLQVACWLTEGLGQQHGISGLLDGIGFLIAFMQTYWQKGWPELDEDGVMIRHGMLNRVDRQLAQMLHCHPLFGQPESTLDHWRKVLAYEHRVTMKPDSAAERGGDDDFSMDTFNRWAATLDPQKVAAQNEVLARLVTTLDTFEVLYGQLNPQADSLAMGQLRSATAEIQEYLKRLFDRAAPAYEDVMTLNVLTPEEDEQNTGVSSLMNNTQKQTMSRDLAISQMLTIAHFFRQTEPSSPVPFLMERAARWAAMTLTEWLEEMLQDDSSMRDINNVLKGHGRE
ncbi:type VI secretion system protein TssA [Rahnella sp. L72c]|uniref:Type VI secretion system protein TssA n=1 Tax=Rahnella perminowiae TaxID=2816244 RepID=A0ABS6L534_9GAMM|nr:type VI secretion system protein TssA [Rahnella perminowiae]MBU9836552.1 type VI secretion system protein TssA [Rahnella perminowiae]